MCLLGSERQCGDVQDVALAAPSLLQLAQPAAHPTASAVAVSAVNHNRPQLADECVTSKLLQQLLACATPVASPTAAFAGPPACCGSLSNLRAGGWVRFSANCRRSQACLLALSVLASMLHKAQTCLRHSSCSISAAARLCLHCAPETLVRHKGRGKVLFHGALSHHTKHEEVLP